MRVFVTGGTGYIGQAVVRTLVEAGHEVVALARTEARARELEERGARPVLGDIAAATSTFVDAAAACEAAIHIASATGEERVAADRNAIDTLLAAARRPGGPGIVIYTSGVWVLGDTGDTPAGEDVPVDHPSEVVAWRPAHERLVLDAADDRLATAVVRPGVVYGGRGGIVGNFFATAAQDGVASIVGEGRNRWSLVHRDDLARLYLLILERRARGIFHGVDGAAIPLAEVVQAASAAAGKGGKVRHVPLEQVRARLGPVADALALDQVVAAPRSLALGWKPEWRPFTESAPEAFREWSEGKS